MLKLGFNNFYYFFFLATIIFSKIGNTFYIDKLFTEFAISEIETEEHSSNTVLFCPSALWFDFRLWNFKSQDMIGFEGFSVRKFLLC